MIHDARKIPNNQRISCDICIVGAGAAGITLALELAQTGKTIILLEAGGMHRGGKSLNLYRGQLADSDRHLPLDGDRYRQLGGTTALWGGRCIPFDPIDFAERDYVPYSGWPTSRQELDPYYQRAHNYCECGKFVYDRETALPQAPKEMVTGLVDSEIVTTKIERWSPPTHFGKVYRNVLKRAGNVHVYLNAICTNIDLTDDGAEVSRLKVDTFRGNTFFVVPRTVVLSGGGLETTRLMLASNQVHKNGIGNQFNWLGRGYMCHINGVIARVKFNDWVKVTFGYEIDQDGVYCRRRILIAEEVQREREILNIHFLLDRPLMEDPAHLSGMLSLAYFTKKFFPHRTRTQGEPSKGKYALYWRHLRNILMGSPEIFTMLPKWFRKRFVDGRRIPSLLLDSKNHSYYLYYHTEQIPNKSSHVRLSEFRDPFGVPRLFLDYRISDIDVDSIYRAHQLIDNKFRENGIGYLVYESTDPMALIRKHQATLGHHIGTTRMSENPAMGVVDKNCKVHGISNLHIASSSVFPTCSQANPTLTIVALAIRLADHLSTF
jgi:choline dehydrogenase-like flavoprotein